MSCWLSGIDVDRYFDLRRGIDGYINIHPLQRGGMLPSDTKKTVLEFADGYSVCDYCLGDLHKTKRPPVSTFREDMAKFLGMDDCRFTHGAREGKFMVMHSIAKPGDTVIVDSLSHYSTYVAAERAGLNVVEVSNKGFPTYEVEFERYAEKIEEVSDRTRKPPVLIVLTHVDNQFGNVGDAKRVGEICKKYGVPFLLNGAYSVGRLPVSGRRAHADFVVASGHKSMASCGPSGVLATTDEWAETVFRKSKIVGNLTGKRFPIKEVELLGCTVRGLPLVSLMVSFPHVVERIKHWEDEVDKARRFIKTVERVNGVRKLGVRPHGHDIIDFDSPSFHTVSQKHRQRGYFLYHELKKRGIVGIAPGKTQRFHISTYGLTVEEVEKVANAFLEMAEKYKIAIK